MMDKSSIEYMMARCFTSKSDIEPFINTFIEEGKSRKYALALLRQLGIKYSELA